MSNRTNNSLKNIKTGFIVQLINKVMAFVVRTVFIRILNTEYLGVNGLFTNILTLLSFAELGVGTAIIFNMYKPVAEKDTEKLKSLIKLYKSSYNVIGIVIFFVGILLIPFLDKIIGEVPNIKENIILIYILFLLNTSASYFFTYKKSIITAHQKQSIINNIDSVFYIIKSIIEIILLVVFKNYIIYLVSEIICTIMENVYVSMVANKMYPYLKDKNVKKISKDDKNVIFSNVKSLVVYQFGGVILNGTDNILISSLINVSVVGLVSNYILIINGIKSILTTALNGLVASVGNLNASEDNKKKEEVFYQMTFAYYLLYSFCSSALVVLLNPFIEIWLGNNYILSHAITLSLVVNLFIEGIRQPGFIYRTTAGLFEKTKSTPYIAAITNIVLSIIFCKLWGLVGIFIATSISQLVSYSWIDPYIIHKYEFKTPFFKYVKKALLYFVTFFIELIVCLLISNLININKYIDLLLKGIIVLIIPNVFNLLFYGKNNEFKLLKERIYRIIKNKLKIAK
jgi:O-antigen/teichoic acid export membrane protein